MSVKTDKLIYQLQQAQQLGQSIVAIAGLAHLDLVYTFATTTTLVINCRNYSALWELDEAQTRLRQAMHLMGLAITTIWIEKNGALAYEF